MHTVWPLKLCVFMRAWGWTMPGTLFNQVCVNMSLKCVQSPSLSTQPPQVDSFSLPSLTGSLTGLHCSLLSPPCCFGSLPLQRLKLHARVLLSVGTICWQPVQHVQLAEEAKMLFAKTYLSVLCKLVVDFETSDRATWELWFLRWVRVVWTRFVYPQPSRFPFWLTLTQEQNARASCSSAAVSVVCSSETFWPRHRSLCHR